MKKFAAVIAIIVVMIFACKIPAGISAGILLAGSALQVLTSRPNPGGKLKYLF